MRGKSTKGSGLEGFREGIDAIDEDIIKLLNKRANLAIEIANIKRKANLRFHSPERERAILERVTKLNKGPFPDDALKVIFREIISASLSLEEPLKVAYLGPEGTFTNLAALRHFGSSAQYIPVASIKAIFDAVERHTGLVRGELGEDRVRTGPDVLGGAGDPGRPIVAQLDTRCGGETSSNP